MRSSKSLMLAAVLLSSITTASHALSAPKDCKGLSTEILDALAMGSNTGLRIFDIKSMSQKSYSGAYTYSCNAELVTNRGVAPFVITGLVINNRPYLQYGVDTSAEEAELEALNREADALIEQGLRQMQRAFK